jgi:hypothetical protein
MTPASAPQPIDLAVLQPNEATAIVAARTGLRATPYRWPDPTSLPRRQWLMGHWLLRGDPCGNGVPIPSREGPEKVPNARRDESGSA